MPFLGNALSFRTIKSVVKFFRPFGICFLVSATSQALILGGKDNSANQIDPGTGVPFDSVASLRSGSGVIGGSGVYLGNGYVLTANHVSSFASVTFDGTTFFTHDGVAPVQVAPGVDMKIFHLTAEPSVDAVSIYTGTNELLSPATIVAYGRGREGTGSGGGTVTWDDDNGSVAKRWGTNQPNATYPTGVYDYDFLATTAGSSAGADEAALVIYDSGSGLFQQISGSWYLTGLATAVSTGDSSTFGFETPIAPGTPRSGLVGDSNYFVRTSSYSAQIATLIPEPCAAILSLLTFPLVLRRKR